MKIGDDMTSESKTNPDPSPPEESSEMTRTATTLGLTRWYISVRSTSCVRRSTSMKLSLTAAVGSGSGVGVLDIGVGVGVGGMVLVRKQAAPINAKMARINVSCFRFINSCLP